MARDGKPLEGRIQSWRTMGCLGPLLQAILQHDAPAGPLQAVLAEMADIFTMNLRPQPSEQGLLWGPQYLVKIIIVVPYCQDG